MTIILVLAAVRAMCYSPLQEEAEARVDTIGSSEPTAGQGAETRNSMAAKPHPIYSVRGTFAANFPDIQDTQIVAARQWGIPPVKNRANAEQRMGELVFVGSSPYYVIDPKMQSSIPYLVPRAADMLTRIATAFLDSLALKGIPAHKIVVSSVLRTEEDVERLLNRNWNASSESCHRYGTTIDIAYNRYHTVCPPGEVRRAVRNDSLKWVLGEVLRDMRNEGRCYVKHEVKQGCFHITTR